MEFSCYKSQNVNVYYLPRIFSPNRSKLHVRIMHESVLYTSMYYIWIITVLNVSIWQLTLLFKKTNKLTIGLACLDRRLDWPTYNCIPFFFGVGESLWRYFLKNIPGWTCCVTRNTSLIWLCQQSLMLGQ